MRSRAVQAGRVLAHLATPARTWTTHHTCTRFQPLLASFPTKPGWSLSSTPISHGIRQLSSTCRLSYNLTNNPETNILNQSRCNVLTSAGVTLGTGAVHTRAFSQGSSNLANIHSRISSLQAKKRIQRKKKSTLESDEEWHVIAYATAEEYDLDGLLDGLTHQGLYVSAGIHPGNDSGPGSSQGAGHSGHNLPDANEVLHMVATYRVESENREIYFFREGSVVFWNVPEIERDNVMRFLKKYGTVNYNEDTVEEESESLTYTYSEGASKTRLVRDKIVLNAEGQTDLEKYAFSNAMAMSVKLGMWEASLDTYIEKIEYVTEELSKTGRVVLSQDAVLQKMGQLFALRHLINLSSDLLDTPDFYWDHAELEQLYQKTSNHLSISKRVSVLNTKLSHCVELMELLKSHLNEKHSARLEWIIIILIMVEVGFELLHYIERIL